MQRTVLFLKNSIVHILLGMIIAILSYLTITSMNSTVYLSEYERCFYCKDDPFAHIGFIILTILFFTCVKRFFPKSAKKRNLQLCLIVIICMYAIVQFFVLYHIRLLPIFDQNQVYNIATRITNHDYSDFFKGKYGEKWTNQWGYLLFLMTTFRILRSSDPNNIYVVNIVFMTGIVWETYGFTKRYIKQYPVFGLMAVCLFIPLWSFSTFIYGNIPACFFCILAVNMLYDFFENNSLPKGILSALCIVISVMLKTTQLIFFIAFLIYLLIQEFSNDKNKGMIKRIIVLALCVLLYFFSGKCIHLYMEHITAMNLDSGVPRIAHIAMGMHETADSSGWYDGYIDTVYEDNGFDIDLTHKEATADLRSSIQRMKSNPSGAIGFFSRKVLSQWIEPTYESILILLNRHAYTEVGQYPVNALPTNRLGAMLVRIMNLIQTLTYFGAFLFYTDAGIRLLKSRNAGESRTLFRDYVNYLLPALILLGGFTFYIFWEANSQYALFFALLLIPCAVSGYGKTSDHVIDAFRHHSIKEEKSFGIPVITILLIATIVFFFSEGTIIERELAPSWSSDQYKSYKSEMLEAGVKEYNAITDIDHSITATGFDDKGRARFHAGRYYIRSASDHESYLIPENDTSGAKIILGKTSDNRMILTSTQKGYTFRFQSTQKVMDVENAATLPGTRVQQYEGNGDMSQIFGFAPSDDGTFWITYANDLVLTAHEDSSVTVETKEDDEPLQLWEVIAE